MNLKASQKGITHIAIVYGIIGIMGLVLTVFVATREVKIPDKVTQQPSQTPDGIVCTADAKLCPDGSYVSRSGPNCEFAPCPVEVDTSLWETYRNEEHGFEFILPPSSFLLASSSSQKRYQNVKDTEKRFLDKNEYFMEIYAFNNAGEKACQDFFADDFPINFEKINLNGLLFYRSIKSATVTSKGPGYGGPLYALCVPTYRGKAFMVDIRADSRDSADMARNILLSFKFYDSSNVSDTFCGGIAGIPCPAGQTCKLDGTYPDAGGVCISTPTKTPQPERVAYENGFYGIRVPLPASWKGFKVIESYVDIYRTSTGQIAGRGVRITIRHPLWTEKNPRQDIPIDMYAVSQWDQIISEEYSVGAAPIPPTELARNSKQVFALPARYNYAYLEGWQEVQEILEQKTITAY